VAYEIFTGKALPRGELQRQWFNTVVLAAGFGVVVGGSIALQTHPIHTLLLTTLLMTLFLALLIWRSFSWRDRYLRQLRPFVASQRLYEHLLSPLSASPSAPEVDSVTPFRALCADILNTERAYLIPLGSLAPLIRPLVHPPGSAPPAIVTSETVAQFRPETVCLRLKPSQPHDPQWAIPLWSERGLIGAFLLGPKRGGSLYTQEEIEIARASGERLIDTQASVEIARRLMTLQRQRLAQSQLLDRQTRRVLHDDVLPQLHTVLLSLGAQAGPNPATTQAIEQLTAAHRQISNLLRDMPKSTVPALDRVGLIGTLQRLILDELPHAFDSVTWQVEPEAEAAARQLPPLTAEVVFYAAREALRNAARHGRDNESGRPLNLTMIIGASNGLSIAIEDDGVGLDEGYATPGSGQGLALHSTMLAIVGGELIVESVAGEYTRVILSLQGIVPKSEH
jgi:signal transduction histidine kinase